jgi:hypothetical protein
MYAINHTILFKIISIDFDQIIERCKKMMELYYEGQSDVLYDPLYINIQNIDWDFVKLIAKFIYNNKIDEKYIKLLKVLIDVQLPESVIVDDKIKETLDNIDEKQAKNIISKIYDTVLTKVYRRINKQTYMDYQKNKQKIMAERFCSTTDIDELNKILKEINIGSNISYFIDEILKGNTIDFKTKITNIKPLWNPGTSAFKKIVNVYKNKISLNEWIKIFPQRENEIQKLLKNHHIYT